MKSYGIIYYQTAVYLFEKVPQFSKKGLVKRINKKYGFLHLPDIGGSTNARVRFILSLLEDNINYEKKYEVWYFDLREKLDESDDIYMELLTVLRILQYPEFRYIYRRPKLIRELLCNITYLKIEELDEVILLLRKKGIIRKGFRLVSNFEDFDLNMFQSEFRIGKNCYYKLSPKKLW